MDWYQANRTCAESRAKLAVPNSQDEQEFLWEFFLSAFDQNPTGDLWIGCNDIEVEGTWKYCPLRDGANAYQNWDNREPNDKGDVRYADCGHMKTITDGKWDDHPCSNRKYAACERPIQKETTLFCLETNPAGRIASLCLVDHIAKELPVTGVLACSKACRSDPRCGSFNLLEIGPEKMQCQLNNATRQEAGSKMNHMFAVLFALGTVCGLYSASICPPNWQQYDESCYLLITQPMDWHQANRTCVQSRAKLAVPNSQDEQKFLWDFFLIDHNPEDNLWIGCNDIEVVGTWKYCPLRNEPNAYQNWHDAEPNDNGGQDCVYMSYGNGKWDDDGCSKLKYAACERPIQKETTLFCLETNPAGRIASACLVDHIVKQLPVTGVLACGKACRSDPRCGSFNLLEIDPGKMQCQLNNATRQEAGELFMKEIQNCYFFNL
ncbi:uncharacterized protein LOC119718819 [Patiria miniata]|uniref:C-type lectin domain-containing protein n=1 Tax=Patiria miniata TaxID=46514 RepID=A0A913YXS2_PATMI|nr:uncharacterized protein LOC119718819 [Patiria miniata]